MHARLVKSQGLRPILAGRDPEKLRPLAARLGLEMRAARLDDAAGLRTALSGVAAETGVVMLIYLDQALGEVRAARAAEGRAFGRDDLREAIMLGAVERVRPKMMTVTAIVAGLVPILWSTGTGSEVMRRIAVPMIGGMVSSTVLTLLVIPAIYATVKGWGLPASGRRASDPSEVDPGTRLAAE